MSTAAGNLYHPANNSSEQIWKGFSWPCLFLGCFWYIYKGMWGWGLIAFVVAVFTFWISWLIFPFFANDQYRDSLIKKGYLTQDQVNRAADARDDEARAKRTPVIIRSNSSAAEDLTKLAELFRQGMITKDEFDAQKKKLFA